MREVSELTGFPEMLDGRLKTIHPRIAGGVLAIRANPEHMQSLAAHGIPPIDMVVVNLYAVRKSGREARRAVGGADREHRYRRADADSRGGQELSGCRGGGFARRLSGDSGRTARTRWRAFASHAVAAGQKAFALTAAYDRAISTRLARVGAEDESGLPAFLDIRAPRALDLRYGENPHQKAALYSNRQGGIAGAEQLQGKELSYNNLVDLDAAWQLIREFDQPASAIIKHTNPCGCAEADRRSPKATGGRSKPIRFGVRRRAGVQPAVDRETAAEIAKTFIEAIAAPGYDAAARELLAAKKNLRLLEVSRAPEEPVVKSISGGYLVQTPDTHRLERAECQVKTERAPTEEEWRALEFAWKVCKHVKSNAIVYAREGQTISVGAGQMSRVDSVKVGAMKAVLPLQGTVLASDAFFPFPDGVEEAAKHGITAVIQPGGSVRDDEGDRRREPAGPRDGVHRRAAFPALASLIHAISDRPGPGRRSPSTLAFFARGFLSARSENGRLCSKVLVKD